MNIEEWDAELKNKKKNMTDKKEKIFKTLLVK